MYPNLGPGNNAVIDPPGSGGASVFYSHDYVAERLQKQNLYAYANSNPIAYVDPTGLAGEDIREINRVVAKYKLSKAGREALHKALQDLKGPGGLAPKAAVEEEAQAIAELGGKYIVGASVGLGVIAAWLSLEDTAQAAEIQWPPSTEKKRCECARFEVSLIVPSWWALFNKEEWGPSIRASDWVHLGCTTSGDCVSSKDPPRILSEQSVTGFTIYNLSYVKCRFGGDPI